MTDMETDVRQPRLGKLIPLFIILFSLPFIGAGLWMYHAGDPLKGGVTTVGSVVDYSSSIDDEGSTTYYPAVRFTDKNGRPHNSLSNIGSNRKPSIGERREVSYLPDNPSKNRVINDSAKWGAWAYLVIGGFIFLCGAIKVVSMFLSPARRSTNS